MNTPIATNAAAPSPLPPKPAAEGAASAVMKHYDADGNGYLDWREAPIEPKSFLRVAAGLQADRRVSLDELKLSLSALPDDELTVLANRHDALQRAIGAAPRGSLNGFSVMTGIIGIFALIGGSSSGILFLALAAIGLAVQSSSVEHGKQAIAAARRELDAAAMSSLAKLAG